MVFGTVLDELQLAKAASVLGGLPCYQPCCRQLQSNYANRSQSTKITKKLPKCGIQHSDLVIV